MFHHIWVLTYLNVPWELIQTYDVLHFPSWALAMFFTIKIIFIIGLFLIYLLHFSLNTTPPPARKPSPKHAAAVVIASSGESNNFVEWIKRWSKNSAQWLLLMSQTERHTHTHIHTKHPSTYLKFHFSKTA